MIQIQSSKQFERAASRLRREPQAIRRHEPGLYLVTNKANGHSYPVRVERFNGRAFVTCGCEAGTPHKGDRRPVVCKHTAALIIYLRAVRDMRARAVAGAFAAASDGAD